MFSGRVHRKGRIAATAAVAMGAVIIAAGGAATSPVSAAFAAPSWTLQIGQPGAAFVYPWGMAWDPVSGTILTSDYNNWQVRRFTPAGTLAGTYSSKAALNGQQPYGIAVDPVTDDFVVDDLEGYLRYSASGTLLDSVSTAPQHAYYAPFLAISPTNERVYVVQSTGLNLSGANVVLMYDQNDNFLGEFGKNGKSCAGGQFGLIRGIDVDSSGNVYVNDVSNHCVQVFSGTGGFE